MGKIDPKESGTDVTITIDANTPARSSRTRRTRSECGWGESSRGPCPGTFFWGCA